MWGSGQTSGDLFSYVSIEGRVPEEHSLRLIRAIVNDVIARVRLARRVQPDRSERRVPRTSAFSY